MQKEGTSAYCCLFFYSHTCSRVRGEMNCNMSQYFSLNRRLLLATGLWPYQQTKLNRLQFVFFFSILTTAVLFQVKDFLTQLQHVYDQLLGDEHESAIIKKYSYTAKLYTTAFIILCICSIFTFIIVQRSSIIDVILPLNTSLPRRLPIMMEYFVDQEKYFLLILLHLNSAFCIGMIVVLATGAMLVAFFIHICGLFKISSYHIEQAMRPNILRNLSPKNDKLIKIILEEIIFAVYIHQQAMRLSKSFASRFETMLLCLIVGGVTSLSLHFFQFFRIATMENNFDEILLPSLLAIVSIVYMFCANYLAQILTDHNNHVFVTVYNIKWYIAPICIQRIILFLLQRNAKEFTISVGGLFVGSLECFASLVKASVSYFTVMYSIQ